jgi:hypothetical protein
MPSGEYEILVYTYHRVSNIPSSIRAQDDDVARRGRRREEEFAISIKFTHTDKMMMGNKFIYLSYDT